MTIHVEQITPEDTALPVWIIYEGRECGFCKGADGGCFPCAGTGTVNDREIARATSEADAERVRAGLDGEAARREFRGRYDIALRDDDLGLDDIVVIDVAMFRMERMDDDYVWFACYLGNGQEIHFDLWREKKIIKYKARDPLPDVVYETRCPLCHHSIHDHAPDCKALHIGQVGC